MSQQITSNIIMIRPIGFDLNEQTLASNAFQQQEKNNTAADIQQHALAEFDNFVELLRQHKVNVIVYQDTPEPFTPDSIFPNNWVSFHADGTVYLYPMQAPNRRQERRPDIISDLKNNQSFEVAAITNLTAHEHKDRFLEGTGSLILDRVNHIAYACLSPRTHAEVLTNWAALANYQLVIFHALDKDQKPIYHTNVVMCVGDTFAVVCLDCISTLEEKQNLQTILADTGHEIIPISIEQLHHFAGNMLQVRNTKGERILVMSQQAANSLSADQINRLQQLNDFILTPALPTIEKYGGGSARCMMAEVFLPKI